MTLKQKPFDVGLLLCLAFLFQLGSDNFKATRPTHFSLGINEYFTELIGGDKKPVFACL